MMFYFEIVIIALQFSYAISRHYSSSDESIENLLYYKDCKKTTAAPMQLREAPPPPPPEIFCTMCCGDSCMTSQKSSMRTQREQFQSFSNTMGGGGMGGGGMGGGGMGGGGMGGMGPPMGMGGGGSLGELPTAFRPKQTPNFLRDSLPPLKPPLSPIAAMKRSHRMSPFPMSRRTLSKEYLKNIISKDQDIKKILKDLVRVTMQKLDLEQMLEKKDPPPIEPKPIVTPKSRRMRDSMDYDSMQDQDGNEVDDYELYDYDDK